MIREFVLGEAADAGATAETINKLDLIVEELVINVRDYAYAGACGEIEVICATEGSQFILSIGDNGPAFNPLAKTDPDTSLTIEERPVGGLGIFLVKQLTSSQLYRREGNKNILTVRVNL